MIIFVIIFFAMIYYGNQFYNLPLPPPCTFTRTTIHKINCCTFMFNMSYSRSARKRSNTVITIKRKENYIGQIIKVQNL